MVFKKIMITLFLGLFLISFINAEISLGYVDDSLPQINIIEDQVTTSSSGNNTNASEYWITDAGSLGTINETQMENSGGTLNILTGWLESFGDDLWCALTGCTMDGDIDMNGNDINDVDVVTTDDLIVVYGVDIGTDLSVGDNLEVYGNSYFYDDVIIRNDTTMVLEIETTDVNYSAELHLLADGTNDLYIYTYGSNATGSYYGLPKASSSYVDARGDRFILGTFDSSPMYLATGQDPRFILTKDGDLIPYDDNYYDIGNLSNRLRKLYITGEDNDGGIHFIEDDGVTGNLSMDDDGNLLWNGEILNVSGIGSFTNSSYFVITDFSTAWDSNWSAKDYDKWMYNMTVYDGTTNASYFLKTDFSTSFSNNFTNSNHNNLANLQGGNGTEYYHVNQTIFNELVSNLFNFITNSVSDLINYYPISALYNKTQSDSHLSGNITASETKVDGWVSGNKSSIETTITGNRTESELGLNVNIDGNRTLIQEQIKANHTLVMNNNETWSSITNSSYLTETDQGFNQTDLIQENNDSWLSITNASYLTSADLITTQEENVTIVVSGGIGYGVTSNCCDNNEILSVAFFPTSAANQYTSFVNTTISGEVIDRLGLHTGDWVVTHRSLSTTEPLGFSITGAGIDENIRARVRYLG